MRSYFAVAWAFDELMNARPKEKFMKTKLEG
jgi:hypothetical protein